MTLEGIVFLIVGIVVAVVFLALPFLTRNASAQIADRERLNLVAAYERALVTVRDIDEDYQMGKLTPDVYENERAKWIAQGAVLLEQIETLGANLKQPRQKERRA